MKKIADMTRVELAGYVCSTLKKNGIHAVLSGGACVSIYSQEKYVSLDLDFIDTAIFSERKKIKAVMESLGFSEHNRYFKHTDTKFFIEFPAGPLGVGKEQVKEVKELETALGMLYLLSPTDCVKDRLTWFYYDEDLQSLEQAIFVAQEHDIDLNEIKRWSKAEGNFRKFKDIKNRLEKNK